MNLPKHLFAADDGALYDTREFDWASHPLRCEYRRHFLEIDNNEQLKATLRAGRTSDLGGYPLALMAADGSVYSFAGVQANLTAHLFARYEQAKIGYSDPALLVVATLINYEDELYCSWTGERIPSAYATEEELNEEQPARVYDAEGWEEF